MTQARKPKPVKIRIEVTLDGNMNNWQYEETVADNLCPVLDTILPGIAKCGSNTGTYKDDYQAIKWSVQK